MFTEHHKQWSDRTEQAFNRALLDRSRLASALRTLLTAVQLEVPRAPDGLLRAEAEAVAALMSVDGTPEVTGAPV